MKFNIPGLLGAIGELPSAVNRGLLGPLTTNPNLGLDPGQVDQARQMALNDMAYGMLAGDRNRPGASLAMARGVARENYSGRIIDMLREQEIVRRNKLLTEEEADKAKLKQQLEAFRAANPDKANLPDSVLLQYMNPQHELAVANLGLTQTQVANSLIDTAADNARADAQLKQQEAQMRAAQANADRQYELEKLKMQADEARFREELRQKGLPQADEVEVRKRREAALATGRLLDLTGRLTENIKKHGTELLNPTVAGQQSALRAQIKSEYKQMYELGTLDAGLNALFDELVANPNSFLIQIKPGGKGQVLTQLKELETTSRASYKSHYEYLNKYGASEGLSMPREPEQGMTMPSLTDVDAEIRRRQQQGML